MIIEYPSAFEPIADWLCHHDEHAEHHFALLDQAEKVLDSGLAGRLEGQQLAERLERWRYQHLHQGAEHWTKQTETLVNALDGLATQLAGRPNRPPRRTCQAVHDPALDTDTIREAIQWSDPRIPLPELTRRARTLTESHFRSTSRSQVDSPPRRRMILYAPLYVSNECINFCTYCGFRYPLEIPRRHLTCAEAIAQVRLLRSRGFRHLLIVGGDYPRLTTSGYYAEILRGMQAEGVVPAIEIAPQTTDSYAKLVEAGARGLTLYQETYDEARYRQYHVRGPKSSYHWRVESHDRAAEVGMRRLGLGVLMGLADPHHDIPAMMRHGAYLMERFPDRTLAFSLPRIHAAPEGFQVPFPVDDQQLIRWYCVLRIAFPRAELVLSTRERAALRNRLAEICITQMSAGSSTAPGGYEDGGPHSGEQFPVTDQRTAADVATWLEESGFEVWWSLDCFGTQP